jgi:plasmid stabilization system protein ParE
MKSEVRVLRRARADADSIYEWLYQRSPQGADSWYAAFLAKLTSLQTNAAGCPVAPEAAKIAMDVRQAFFKSRRGKSYRLLFIVEQNAVRVLRVRGPGQRPVTRRDIAED